MIEVVVTTGAIRRAKLQSNRHYQQTNTQLFTGRMLHQFKNALYLHALIFFPISFLVTEDV